MYEPLRVGLGLARSRSVKLRAFFDWKSRPFELRPARPLMRALYVLCLDLTALRLTPSKAAVLLYGRSFKLLNDRTVATPRRCRNIVFCFAVRKVFLWIFTEAPALRILSCSQATIEIYWIIGCADRR
jgi:hypothetical protein